MELRVVGQGNLDGTVDQIPLPGTSVEAVTLADHELMLAQQHLQGKAMSVMVNPVQASESLEKAQRHIQAALSKLVNPNSPSNIKAIAQIASAGHSVWQAIDALDSESGKTIAQALKFAAIGNERVEKARDTLVK